ncbi:MAG: SurA N-terminal domain-containing protein [Deltaproteobacteria bacterium]|nr:SurA N-terminal domain-containing protein [Deltaproteobacteria bacterium]
MRYVFSWLTAVFFCFATVQASAAEVIEQVVAVVNEDAILLSDLRQQAAPFLRHALGGATSDAQQKQEVQKLYRQLLEQMINQKLIQQTANEMRITVSKIEIDQAIDNVRRQNNLDEQAFWDAVRDQGYTPQQYREDIRKQLINLKVTNQRIRSRASVTEEEIRERYEKSMRQARRALRFRAAHVYFELAPEASATEVKNVRETAEAVRAQLSLDNFDAAAEKYGGGDLGWLSQGDLPEPLEKALLNLSVQEISQPVRGPSGIHIFILRERQSGAEKLPAFEETRESIQQKLMEEAMTRQQQLFLEQIRGKAIIDIKLR